MANNLSHYHKIQTFINWYLRRISRIYWPDKIATRTCGNRPNRNQPEQRSSKGDGRWIGHTLRKPVDGTARQALSCEAAGETEKRALQKVAVERLICSRN